MPKYYDFMIYGNKRNETAHLAQGYDCAGAKI